MKNVLENWKRKKIEMSKLILIVIAIVLLPMILVAIILGFMGYTSVMEIAMTGIFSLAGVSVGFYYWKAKAENMHKYKQDNKIDMNEGKII